ncbi:AAA family ATPase [Kribbella sp. NPDC026596]|uniref:ATP-binding protein n=1 Tax=Kribbella sp. NPDC026596 TaxID=3155122 RepID=UPI0033EA5093
MSSSTAPSTVFVLGPLEVTDADGRTLGPVPAGRAGILLRRLVAAGGAVVDIDALVDALWDDDAPLTADRVIASLVSRVRRAIGPDVITGHSSTGYRFNCGRAWTSDLALLEELTKSAHARAALSPAVTVTAARRAFGLLTRGHPELPPAVAQRSWAEDQQRHVDALTRRLNRASWEAQAQLGMWSEIANQAESVLSHSHHDEQAGRALMNAQWQLGDRASALRTYDELRLELRKELEVEPSPETDALFSAIVSGADPGPVRAPRPGAVAGSSTLIGRQDEYAEMVDRWHAAAAGQAGAILVTGSPGSGCSSLAQELDDYADRSGARAIRVDCFEGERSSPLQPLVTVLSRILLSTPPDVLPALVGSWTDTAVELVPDLRDVVGVTEYQRASPEIEHRRILNTLRHVLATTAEDQPLLLFFDDLHLAGAATVEALQWLLHTIDEVPLLVVATVPSDRLDSELRALADNGLLVELGPLTEADVALLAKQAGNAPKAAFVWELTQGQPMFVVEVLAALGRGEDESDIPGTLRSMVLDRVRRSCRDVEELLQSASVIGTAFDVETLEQLVGRPAVDLMPTLQKALAAGLLASRNELFVSSPPILGQALYDNLPGPVRVLRHRQLAEIFLARPELRAHHQQRAGLTVAAARSWYEAATLARRSFANADAVRLFTSALDTARTADDPELEGLALIGRGASYEELGEYDAATEDHQEAEALALARGDRSLRATAVERLGWTAYYRRDVEEAVARADEASRMPGARPSAWNLLGRTKHWAGDFDAAYRAYERALDENGDEVGAVKASVSSCLGALLAHADRYGEAIEVLDDAVSISNSIGAFHPLLRALFFAGLARGNAGDLSGALTVLQTKAAILERYDVSFYRARTNTTLAWVWRELGERNRAHDLSELALSQSREVEAGSLQIEQELHALCSLADSERLDGQLDRAAERLETASRLIEHWLPFRWRADLRVREVRCRIGLDDPEALLEAAKAARSLKYQALAFHLLGRGEEAAALARETGSLLLLGEVGAPDEARDALRRLEATLPRQLRACFAQAGRLPRAQS